MEWRFESADQIYPSSLRTEIMTVLRSDGDRESDFSSAELIYGELISNVIRHARGAVRVRLDWADEYPTLCVIDEQSQSAPPIRLPPDPLAESGRGLFIVRALAKDFVLTADADGGRASATLPVRRRASATL